MKKAVAVVFTVIFIALLVIGCSDPSENGAAGVSGSGKTATASSKETAAEVSSKEGSNPDAGKTVRKESNMEGTWYEQNLDGSRIIISGKQIRYESGYSDYTDESKYKTKKNGGRITVIPDVELFSVVDIEYDPEQDVLTAHTWPHMDGDGGYHLLTYRRTEFTPTPEPTYGARKDESDPAAPKTVGSYDFTSLKMSFYDEGDTSYIGTDMAMQPPYADYYDYELNVLEDGSADLTSSFCPAISVTWDLVDDLKTLMEENGLASINGLDIHTEGIPYGFPTYDFELTLESGETIRSSADYKDVPENWSSFQTAAHNLLFDAFTEAGYNAGTGEFHTTKPMKRIGREEQTDLGVRRREQKLTRSDRSYDYDVYAKYTVFEFGDETPAALQKALKAYSDSLKEAAEQDIENDYELMEGATKAEIKKAERLYAYSFRSAEYMYGDDLLYYVFESEGHANSLGIGYSGYGLYPYHRYAFDTQTGERIFASDLFIDEEAAFEAIYGAFCEGYSRAETLSRLQSEEIRSKLRAAVRGENGVKPMEFSWRDDRIDFYMPTDVMDNDGYQMDCWIYYEDIQDILSDRYAPVR